MADIFANNFFEYIPIEWKKISKISNEISMKCACNRQEVNIGLDNGMVPKRWQAIILTNDDPIHLGIYQWPSARLQHLHCWSTGDNAVLH